MSLLKITAAALSIALGATAALAQATTTPSAPVAPKAPAASTAAPSAPATTTTAPAAAKKGVLKKASTPEGTKCSAEADAKNLHGKERVKFRRACITAAKKEAGAAPAKKN